MDSAALLGHDNLLDAYPDAESAECDGYGSVKITVAGEPSYRAGRCPVCEQDRLGREITGFVPKRFRPRIDVPAGVDAWLQEGKQAEGLYISGQVGTGKTHAAWEAVARWCAATRTRPHDGEPLMYDDARKGHPSVVFTRMTDLLDSLRPGDDGTLRIGDCQHTRLLVLDDVGAEKATEWTQERIYSIVDHRYANCLPLIITSNLPASDLAPQIGERAASRLAEMCRTVVAMTGADRRWPA